MAWPTVALLRSALGVTSNSEELGERLGQALCAAVEQVCNDAGYPPVTVTTDDMTGTAAVYFEDVDPDESGDEEIEVTANHSLAQAALLLAVSVMKAPDAPHGVAAVFDAGGMYVARSNPHYQRLLVGNRVRFGVG